MSSVDAEPTTRRARDASRRAAFRTPRPPSKRSSATRSSAATSVLASTSGCACAPTPGCRGAVRQDEARADLLRLPVGHRLDAVAVRPLRGRRGRHAARRQARVSPTTLETGYAGGDTRFQMLARVFDVRQRHVGVTLKADVPDDTMTMDSWVRVYAGADWHERETWEMYGINFEGHPGLRHIYLPTRVRRPSAAQGLPAPHPRREAVARHRRRRADARRTRRRRRRRGRGESGRATNDRRSDRSAPAAAVHRRAGSRRPRQRRARDRGHDPQHRAAASRDARHAPHHRAPRRRAGDRRPTR